MFPYLNIEESKHEMNYIFKYSSIETLLHINVPTLEHSKNNHAKVKIQAINHAKVMFLCNS